MKTASFLVRVFACSALAALVLTSVFVSSAIATAPRYEIVPYYSVVRDEPYAPFTAADELKRTSLLAYYSVVH